MRSSEKGLFIFSVKFYYDLLIMYNFKQQLFQKYETICFTSTLESLHFNRLQNYIPF